MRRQAQRGIVLVVALILMGVIAVSTAVVMKGALAQDRVAAGIRANSMAVRAAEMALRYCEARVSTVPPPAAANGIPLIPRGAGGAQQVWQTLANWNAANFRAIVPSVFLFDGGNAVYNRLPECMVEEIALNDALTSSGQPGRNSAFVVTARGFSPDYLENAQGFAVTGAVIWIQSTVQYVR